VALGAVALISDMLGPHHRRAPRAVFIQAAVSGLTFGSLFVMLDHTSDGSGLWPVVAMRASSVPYLFVMMALTRQRARSARAAPRVVVGSGVLDSVANALYLLAVREGLMTIVAVIVAMYPASTLALAIGIDRERVHRPQILGLVLAGVALLMLTLG
jgi:drug/metabolite transporter (DMT)-like permease